MPGSSSRSAWPSPGDPGISAPSGAGVPVDSSVYTVEQAARELLRLKGGKGSC